MDEYLYDIQKIEIEGEVEIVSFMLRGNSEMCLEIGSESSNLPVGDNFCYMAVAYCDRLLEDSIIACGRGILVTGK